MKNRRGERKKKRRGKKKQTDQQGVFLTRIISECNSSDKSSGFYTDFGLSDVLMDCLFPSEPAGAAVQTPQPLAAPAPVPVPGSVAELEGHAPHALTSRRWRDTLPTRRQRRAQCLTGKGSANMRSLHTVTLRAGQLPEGTSHPSLRAIG